jgi:hypothetical protein
MASGDIPRTSFLNRVAARRMNSWASEGIASRRSRRGGTVMIDLRGEIRALEVESEMLDLRAPARGVLPDEHALGGAAPRHCVSR